jgi:hypothetical protein
LLQITQYTQYGKLHVAGSSSSILPGSMTQSHNTWQLSSKALASLLVEYDVIGCGHTITTACVQAELQTAMAAAATH